MRGVEHGRSEPERRNVRLGEPQRPVEPDGCHGSPAMTATDPKQPIGIMT